MRVACLPAQGGCGHIRVVLITSGGSGIGLETAVAFAKAGYAVYASMRDPRRSARLDEAAAAAGVHVSVIALGVTEPASVEAATGGLLEREGWLDVPVNNAGIGELGAVETLPPAQVLAIFETNVFGAPHVLRAVPPTMRCLVLQRRLLP